MTIEDLWDKMLTFDLLDLLPIFDVLAMSFVAALVLIVVGLGGMVWWLHRREQ